MSSQPLLKILLVLSTAAYVVSESPCLRLKDVNPKRYVNHQSKNYPLVLGVSDRLTHRLTTEVFKIFLVEVLGYPDVTVKNMSDSNDLMKIMQQMFTHVVKEPPKIMIDLEAWIPLGENTIHLLEEYRVREYGYLGPPVRYGWFVPLELLQTKTNTSIVVYNSFRSLKSALGYSIMDDDIAQLNISDSYVPPQCENISGCATLIAPYNDSTANFIKDDIEKLQLFVKVYWIYNFNVAAKNLLDKYLSRRDSRIPIFFGHSFDLLPLTSYQFTQVVFPICDPYSDKSTSPGCHYEGQRIVKLAWDKLDESASAAHNVLQKVDFNASDYHELIDIFYGRGEMDYYDTACQWMQHHQTRITQEWSAVDEVELSIVGIFPLRRKVFSPIGIFTGAQMAIDEINDGNLLGNYKLNLLLEDGDCRADVVMRTFISFIVQQFRKIVGILGPACSETVEPLAGVATHFQTVVISYSAEGSSFSDRSKYPYFFRTIGENRQYQYVYQGLFKKLKWRRVASLSEDGTKYTEYVSQTQDLLMKDGVTFIANRKFSQAWMNEPNKMSEYLKEFKSKEARIIIADVNEAAAKAVMCEAYHMNMTAKNGFVWFLPSWLMPFWLEDNDLFYNETSQGRNVYCSSHEMLEAIDAHLSLSHAFFASDNDTIHSNMTVKEWKKEYKNRLKNATASDYAGYAYDAVWVYAKALDSLIRENQTYISNLRSKNVTERYVSFIQNTNFSGVSGLIEFKGGPSRNGTRVNIFQWNSKIKQRVEVGHYDPRSRVKFVFDENRVRWLTEGGKVPWDGTTEGTCIVDWFAKMLNTECQTALVVANIFGIGLILLLVLVGFLFIKHRYDKKVQLTEKYMKSLGLDLLSVTALYKLDSWEMPKDRVVINRKLGEGAFGMVYGGEAFFDEKGWVAVAVKTLKVGSTPEQKLDFLSEADVMKKFEHKNIVQLLGVCTKNEPVYTIMEFMLYGDLKTFLLARRHLVNDRIHDDNDEISSVRLTNMALDIARALSYLAEMKFVHRDVASRNCLVNASRVVKLGDFGMTRPMCDNDYYKFTRKGWLPVRWMAPESLGMGVFTPASDVWSFGVLLYEIITFGNFPFQGMSNREVLDYVKEGHSLTIPSGVKVNLEGLIKSCWNIDPQKRPQAAEIVEFLANNPRLLSPSLDGPLLSVPPVEESTFTMPFDGNKTRKFSLRQRISSSPSNDLRPWPEVSEPLLPSLGGTYRSDGFHAIPEDQIAVQDATFPL